MLGSVHDAEDLVQETMLRAWRSYADFDPGRASMRTWLHRIATNACLNALDSRSRRPLPSDLTGPGSLADAPHRPSGPHTEITWLQPFPDTLLAGRIPAGRPTRPPSSRRGTASGSRSWPPCSTCRPGSGRC